MTSPRELTIHSLLNITAKLCTSTAEAVKYRSSISRPDRHLDDLVNRLQPHCDQLKSLFSTVREWHVGGGTPDWRGGARRTKQTAVRLILDLVDYLFILQSQLTRSQEAHNGRGWALAATLMAEPFVSASTRINEPIGPNAMRAFLPYVAEELKRATAELSKCMRVTYPAPELLIQTPDLDQHPEASISASINAVLGILTDPAQVLGIPLPLDTLTHGEATPLIGQLQLPPHLATLSLDDLASKRIVLRVPGWSGEWEYPDFQFDRRVANKITELLPKIFVPEDPDGRWAIALYLRDALYTRDQSVASVIEELVFANSWEGAWGSLTPDDRSDIQRDVAAVENRTETFPTELHRVARLNRSIYHYDCIPAGPTPTIRSTRGRLTPSTHGAGVCYFAGSETGTWSEAMAGKLTLTLADVLGRAYYHISIDQSHLSCPSEVTDMTSGLVKDRTIKARRPVTQALADCLLEAYPQRIGVKYPLKTSDSGGPSSSVGYAVWGPAGEHDPAALQSKHAYNALTGAYEARGTWTGEANAVSALKDGSGLLEYLIRRNRVFPEYPIALWRFPRADDLVTSHPGQG